MKINKKISAVNDKKAKSITITFAAMLLLGGAIIGVTLSSGDKKVSQIVVPASQDFSSVLGATSNGSGVGVTANNITSSDKDPGITPGNKRITLSLTISNTGADIIEFSPGLNISILGDNGSTYIPTMKFSSDTEIKGGPIKPGSTLNLDLDFEIPVNITAKKLHYQKDLQSSLVEISL